MTKLTDAQKVEIVAKRNAGASLAELSEAYGVAKSTLSRLVTKTNEANGPIDGAVLSDFTAQLGLGAATAEPVPAPAPTTPKVMTPADEEAAITAMRRLMEEEARQTVRIRAAQAVSASAVAAASSDDPKEAIIQKIVLNIENFGPLLSFIKDPKAEILALPKKSFAELRSQLELIERTRSLANLANGMKHSFGMACLVTEVATQKFFKMQTGGFTRNILSQEDELNFIFKELAVESYSSWQRYTRPEARLAMIFVTGLLQTDAQNRGKAKATVAAAEQAEVSPEEQQKFADL